MTEPTEKKDYAKDGICFANRIQEKECRNFKPIEVSNRYPDCCKFQGTGMYCEAVKE